MKKGWKYLMGTMAVLTAAAIALMVQGCQHEDVLAEGEEVVTSIEVNIPHAADTRAVAADFGKGKTVNRCVLQVYHNGHPYGAQQVAAVQDDKATFENLRLVATQTYRLVVWADCGTAEKGDLHYNTTDMKAIALVDDAAHPYTGNSDEFDAFTAYKDYKVINKFQIAITLQRPFGLLTIKTNDLDQIPSNATALKPVKYTASFKQLPNLFNAYSGVASGALDLDYTADMAKADGTVSMDYILGNDSEAVLANFAVTFLDQDGKEITTNKDFVNIPIRRNYKTNVSGNLVTKSGKLDVEIAPDFASPDMDHVIPEQ